MDKLYIYIYYIQTDGCTFNYTSIPIVVFDIFNLKEKKIFGHFHQISPQTYILKYYTLVGLCNIYFRSCSDNDGRVGFECLSTAVVFEKHFRPNIKLVQTTLSSNVIILNCLRKKSFIVTILERVKF